MELVTPSIMSTRRERGLTENIYLVKLDKNEDSLTFHVLGTSNHVYTVLLKRDTAPKCSCPDHKIRKRNCKHIYFVCERIVDTEPHSWIRANDISAVQKGVLQRLPHLHLNASEGLIKRYEKIIKGGVKKNDKKDPVEEPLRNTECCVCLDEIERKNAVVCSECNNGVHGKCWERWKHVHKGTACVYCRTVGVGVDDAKDEMDTWGVRLE